MENNNMVRGSVAGTGAAINVVCGFVPGYVKVFNPNDAGSLFPTMERFQGMAAASGFKTLGVVDNATTGNKSSNYVTTNGLSDYSGTSGAGFTIGADTDINVNGETIYYIAIR